MQEYNNQQFENASYRCEFAVIAMSGLYTLSEHEAFLENSDTLPLGNMTYSN